MLDFKDISKNIVFGTSRKMSDMRGSRKFSYIYIFFLTRNNINNTNSGPSSACQRKTI